MEVTTIEIKYKYIGLRIVLGLSVLWGFGIYLSHQKSTPIAEAQCAAPILEPKITLQRWRNPSHNTNLGRWDFCALVEVQGIDDKKGEGAGVDIEYDTKEHPAKIHTVDNRPSWEAYRGEDVDVFEIECFKIDFE